MNRIIATSEIVRKTLQRLSISEDYIRSLLENDQLICAYINGSVVYGLANRESDIDITVVTEHRMKISKTILSRHHWVGALNDDWYGQEGQDLLYTFDYLDEGRRAVEVEYRTSHEINTLNKRIEQDFERACEAYDASPYFSYSVSLMDMERWINSWPMVGIEKYRALQSINVGEKVSYLVYRRLTVGWEVFKDLRGVWREKQLNSTALQTRQIVTQCVQAWLSLLGITTLWPRWIYERRLLLHGDSESDLMERLENYLKRGWSDESEAKQYVEDGLVILQEIFADERRVLETSEVMPHPQDLLKLAESERNNVKHKEAQEEIAWWENRYREDPMPLLRGFLDV